jgi:pimeloyl-ACP methyl ester carboxylesterase
MSTGTGGYGLPVPGPARTLSSVVTSPSTDEVSVKIFLAFISLLAVNDALAGAVKLKTTDGVTIAGVESGSGAKGVVLVHGDGRTASDWTNFSAKLASQGFHVLAIDLRGHGGSALPAGLTEADWPKMVNDVAAGAAYLRTRGAKEVNLVGADVGGSLALNEASTDAAVTSLALVSPTISAHGVKVSEALAAYGQRPILLVAASGDSLSAKAANLLGPKALGPKQIDIIDGNGSGAQLLNIDAALEGTLIGWLNGSWRGPNADAPKEQINNATVGDLQSTGTRIDDHK